MTGANGCSSLGPEYNPYTSVFSNVPPSRNIYAGYGMDSTISSISTTFCAGDSVELIANEFNIVENNSVPFSLSYQWFYNDAIIPNANNPSYYANQNGNYYVVLKSPGGYCTYNSEEVEITENPLPIMAVASSTESGFVDNPIVLQSPFPTGQAFSWSPALGLNDSTLASPSFTPLQNGTYSFVVKATDNNGCSNADTVKVEVAGITGTVKGTISNPVKVYPNPYSGFTNISYQLNEQASVTAEVFNIIGERLSQFVNETQEPGAYHYQFSGEASGMYIIKITINSKEYYQKIVQQ